MNANNLTYINLWRRKPLHEMSKKKAVELTSKVANSFSDM
jgi:hypothetical protein